AAEALRVRAEDPELARHPPELLQGLSGCDVRVSENVQVERVLPRVAAQRPRLDLAEVRAARREGPERPEERARLVVEHEHDRGLRELPDGARLLGQDQEARVVLRVVLDALE